MKSKMTPKELKELLNNFNEKFGHVKQWQIDRVERCKAISKDGAKARGKTLTNKHQSTSGKERAKKGGTKALLDGSSFDSRSKGGKVTGKKHVESGHWKKVQEAALNVVTQEVSCPHCTNKGNLNIMKRWHFDNCKWKGFNFDNVFKLKQRGLSASKIAKELGLTRFNINDILNGKLKSK